MVKTIVALLVLLLVLVGPASAQEPDPQSEESSADASAEPSANPDPTPDPAPASDEPQSQDVATQQEQSRKACRVAATYIADPKVSPLRWVNPDPDGCFRRTVDRLIPPLVRPLVQRIL